MPPKVLGTELGGPRKDDPRREPSEAPRVESDEETRSQAAQVAEFRTSRFSLSMPAAVLVALITAVSGFAVAWLNKPAAVALTPEQSAKLDACAAMGPRIERVESYMRWLEPQIGVILVRLDQRPYTPPPSAQPVK